MRDASITHIAPPHQMLLTLLLSAELSTPIYLPFTNHYFLLNKAMSECIPFCNNTVFASCDHISPIELVTGRKHTDFNISCKWSSNQLLPIFFPYKHTPQCGLMRRQVPLGENDNKLIDKGFQHRSCSTRIVLIHSLPCLLPVYSN